MPRRAQFAKFIKNLLKSVPVSCVPGTPELPYPRFKAARRRGFCLLVWLHRGAVGLEDEFVLGEALGVGGDP